MYKTTYIYYVLCSHYIFTFTRFYYINITKVDKLKTQKGNFFSLYIFIKKKKKRKFNKSFVVLLLTFSSYFHFFFYENITFYIAMSNKYYCIKLPLKKNTDFGVTPIYNPVEKIQLFI